MAELLSKHKNALEIWNNLIKAYYMLRKAQVKFISKYKLTVPQFGVLEVLMHSGPTSLKNISRELMVTGANITCVVDNLEKENLVQRVHSSNDRRIVNAELTSRGREKMESIFPDYLNHISEAVSFLPHEEQKLLNRILQKIKTGNEA